MEASIVRSRRPALVMESLEDRRLLSHFGQARIGDDPHPAIANPAEVARPGRETVPSPGDDDWYSGQDARTWTTSPDPDQVDPSSTDADRSVRPAPGSAPSFDRGSTPAPSPVAPTPTGPVQASTTIRPCQVPAQPSPSTSPAANARVTEGPAPGTAAGPVAPTVARDAPAVAPFDNSGRGPGNDVALASPPSASSAHGAQASSTARSAVTIIPTAHEEVAASGNSESSGHPAAGTLTVAGVVSLSVNPGTSPGTPGHGSTTSDWVMNPGWVAGKSHSNLELGGPKNVTEARSADEIPPLAIGDEGAAIRPGVESFDGARTLEGLEPPDPQLADVIMSLVPFGRSSLEHALDQFLEPFDGLSSAMAELDGPLGLVSASLAVAVGVLTTDLSLRLRRARDEEGEADGEGGLIDFPGLPGPRSWSHS